MNDGPESGVTMNRFTFALAAPGRRRLFGLCGGALLLAACGNLETHTLNIQTAAAGTRVEARQVVTLVYAQAADGEIDKLLYAGYDLGRAVKRIRDRHPQIRARLDDGSIGYTAGGFVALRELARCDELRQLLWDENRDRAFLYNQASAAVGHGGDDLNAWLPYASHTFGKEWIGQGKAGWWVLDEERNWTRR